MAKNLLLGSKEDVRLAIRRRSHEIAEKMTDEEFFTCAQFKRYATSLVDFILRKHRLYSMQIVYNTSPDGPIAYTDGKMIFWNVGNSLARFPKRLERRFKVNMGIVFHEAAHKLFMDFQVLNKIMDTIKSGKLYGNFETNGDPELEKALAELKKVTESPYAKAISVIYSNLSNIIDDGHDEKAMKRCFPGFIRECIDTAGEVQMETASTLRELIDNRVDSYSLITGLMLQYAKFGVYKIGEENDDTEKIVELVTSLETTMDLALDEDDYEKRFDHINMLMLGLWPFLREKFPENPESQPGDGSSSSGQPSGGGAGGSGGSGGAQAGQSPGETSSDGTQSPASQGAGSQSASSSGQSGSANGTMSAEELAEALSKAAEAAAQEMGANPTPTNCNDAAVDPSEVSSCGMDMGSGADAMRLQNEASEEKATQDIQRQMDQAEKEAMRNINLPLIHKNVRLVLNRHNEEDPELYRKIKKEVDPITRNLVNAMKVLLRDMNEDYLQRHRAYGPVIVASDMYRQDKRFFAKKKLPADQPDLALCVLIDQSGSMRGTNLNYARKAAIMLERFASELDIPLMVAGHNTGYNCCRLMIYTDFNSAMTEKDRYSIAGMSASGSNRDGYAIRVCADLLAQRPEQVKMMIIISDGTPADDGYQGEEAMQDITDTVTEFRRKGMLIYGAAIAEDRDVIEKIYGKNFLNITNLASLPNMMVRLVRQQIT